MSLSTQDNEIRLSLKNIEKAFGLNRVLKGVSFDVKKGEVVALIGGNGAGKSTLMKIIMGIYFPDAGEIFIDGLQCKVSKPSVSLANGAYLVPQEPLLFPNMTVLENVAMGLDEKSEVILSKINNIMKELNCDIALDRKAETLSIAEQQLVEILRGLMHEAKLLILDEPTSSLTFNEVQRLFEAIRDLKSKGISIIYITHRLPEVFEISDSIVIMRDGVITAQGPSNEFTHDMLLKGLLPADSTLDLEGLDESKRNIDYNNVVLEVKNLSGYGFSDISLKVHAGEVLGLAGVVGAGRTELATTIFGRDKVLSGDVYLKSQKITGFKTKKLLEMGVAYLAEDRFLNGIFGLSDISANTSASSLNSLGKFFINKKKEKEIAQHYAEMFNTKITGLDDKISSLSGGNQQKVVIARALASKPKLLILDEPTRGIDVIARADVYNIIRELQNEGIAILLISSDMEEIIELSDRALSMYNGRINAEFTREGINQDSLTKASFGIV